ncbi:MAG: hypothetical protein ACOX6L_02370 [Syntrophomonadaceae bacterium]|jgi:heme/copper-type cytochrome/quinol oxidase subunit 2
MPFPLAILAATLLIAAISFFGVGGAFYLTIIFVPIYYAVKNLARQNPAPGKWTVNGKVLLEALIIGGVIVVLIYPTLIYRLDNNELEVRYTLAISSYILIISIACSLQKKGS